MKIETKTDRLWAAHVSDPMRRFFDAEDRERRAIEDLISQAETAILRDALRWGPDGMGDSTFTFAQAPWTVLVTDPSKMPTPPAIRLRDQEFHEAAMEFERLCEDWGGGGIVESICCYPDENPEFLPFTVLGWWTDFEVGGPFGIVKGKEEIVVLFG